MSRVLLLATTTGYQTRAFGEAAERLGVELVFATDRCDRLDDPWRDHAIPIRFYDENRSVRSILASSAERPVDGVVVVGDRPAVIGARVLEALGLPGHPPAAAAAAGNKQQTRECFRAAGLLVPWVVTTTIAADPHVLAASLEYPCVVKPVALSGSRGVMRVDDPEGFVAAFTRLVALLRSPDILSERRQAHEAVLIEGFIPGREYAIEGLLHHGRLQVLTIFDKPDPLDGPFFEETLYVTPSGADPRVQEAIEQAVARAAAAIGLCHGPIHAECRVDEASKGKGQGGVFVLEVAARPIGGLCARALRFEPDLALEDILLRHALGRPPEGWRREARPSGVMMIPIPKRGVFRRADRVEAARQVPGIDDVRITAKTDQLLVPLPEGASYLGFIFAHGDTPAGVECALRAAHHEIQFVIDPELPVLTRA